MWRFLRRSGSKKEMTKLFSPKLSMVLGFPHGPGALWRQKGAMNVHIAIHKKLRSTCSPANGEKFDEIEISAYRSCLTLNSKKSCQRSNDSHFCCLHHSSFVYAHQWKIFRNMLFLAQIRLKKLLLKRLFSSNVIFDASSPCGVTGSTYLLDGGGLL